MTPPAQPTQPQGHPGNVRPFADGVLGYAQAGWTCILPVPPATKTPPPSGFTGAEGADTTPIDLARWAGQRANDSIALRMPLNEHWCVIGIDVDAYEKAGPKGVVTKRGDVTIAHFEGQWGPLPPTWSSTARGTSEGPGVSRIRFYRAPAQRYATKLAAEHTGDVEIIQRHHRYAVVAPSVHPDAPSPDGRGAGGLYRWYGPDERPTDVPPRPDQLPELPPAWVAGLAEGAASASVASADRPLGEAMLEQLTDDWRPECAEITNARQMAVDRLTKAEAGSRHDAMTERTHHLVQLAAAGHAGVARALAEVRALWGDLTMGEDRRGEYQRALLTSARKAVTAVGEVQVPRDPCLLVGAASYAAPAPSNHASNDGGGAHDGADDEDQGPGEDVEHDPVDEPIAPPRWWSVREQIGAHAFDPNAGLDQPLAEAVLERTWPILRYAYDSRGWLLRVPDRWELHGDQSQWAVATVASLMPVGDPEAEKGTDAHERSARRARFNTQAGAKAIGGKMTALVSGGMHPAAIRLAALDSEPDVLWAGGMPWSLTQSVGGPTLATLDPSTPHLHSAGVTPEVRPTPLWDAFLAAVFPDPELRAWALRVLAICLTGYADRALPILLGETGRGKALDVDTPMLTLRGWSTMGDLVAGDLVYGPDGVPTRVEAAHAVMHDHDCYRVVLDDGRDLVADAEHLWTVEETSAGNRRTTKTLTTQDMVDAGLTTARDRRRFHLPLQNDVYSPDISLPIEPYLLGVWLGDGRTGGAMLELGDQDVDHIVSELEQAGTTVTNRRWARTCWRVSFETTQRGQFSADARALRILDRKAVPEGYLTAGTYQRLALLQGLLDTDGYVGEDGRVEFTSTNPALASAVTYLARSLGWSAREYEDVAQLDGRVISPRYRVFITARAFNRHVPFRLPRRVERYARSSRERSLPGPAVVSIEPVESRPVRCIKVARADGLFLAGRGLVPTHNTQVVHLLMSVLGTYAHAADPRLLTPAGENAHASIVYALKGRRLSFIDEGPREGRVAQERLKQITGGGELTANQMNQNPITFTPTHTVVMTTNDDPPLVDPAVRSRARLIPCDGDPEEIARTRRAIGHVKGARWRTEAPGVLAALMGEAAGWLADPTSAGVAAAPSRIRYLAETLGAGQDPVIVWLNEETEAWEQGTASRELYQAFTASCLRNNLRRDTIPTETKWGRTLTQLGYPVHHTRTGKVRQLRIRQMGPGGPALPPTPADFLGTRPEAQPGGPVDAEGPGRDGLVTGCDGFAANPSHVKPQVNPNVSVDGDGLTGLTRPYVHAQAGAPAHTPAGSPDPQKPVNPSQSDRETPPDLQERSGDGLANPPEPPANPSQTPELAKAPARQPAKKREQTEDARAKKAAARAERIAAAVAEAQGPLLQLPAVVARDPQAPGQVVVGTLGVPDVDALLATITDTSAPLTVDVETSGYPIGHEHFALRTVQLGNESFAAVLDPSQADQADAVRRHLAAATTLHAHSATADLVPLEVAGLLTHGADEAWSRMVDTVTLAKLADPASTGSDPGLKQISTAMLGEHGLSKAAEDERKALFKAGGWLTETKATTPLARSGWAQVTSASTTMIRYAAADVLDDAAIATRLQQVNGQTSQATGDVTPDVTPAVLAREHLAQRMVARVAHRGLRIDGEHTDRLLTEHIAAREAHADTVRTMTGQLGEHQVDNPGSNAQVGAALTALGAHLPRTATGKPSVAQGVLDPLAKQAGDPWDSSPAADLAKAVLDYRHHDTAVGTFLEPYAELVRNGDGRARPTVYTLAADTGRMSCVRPNLQQVPREGGFRACITADPGQVLVSADFAGVELRVAAALSQDANLLAILSDPDRDLHGEIARIAFGPQATKADRYAAKRGVFGRIYGGGVGAIARGVGVSEATARSVIDAMDTLTPGLAEWSRRTRTAIEAGHTRFPTYSGRVVHMPKDRPHAGPNYCVTPDTLILRSDLRHVPAGDIQAGDRLVAFDEHPGDASSGNKYHRMRTAIAERTSTVIKPSVTVRTADGQASTCSADHLWLARPLKTPHRGPHIRWIRADQLQPGDALLSLGTWQESGSRTAGYLAGLYDGEGSMASRGEGHGHTALTFSQLPGLVMDAFTSGMAELGLGGTYATRAPHSTSPTDAVRVNGVRNVMRVLGTLQPRRFQPRYEQMYEGAAITAGLTEPVAVTAVEDAGDLKLVSIQTSTRTLVANGYLSHNCIQGTARELLVDALTRWSQTPWAEATLLPVHDELVVAVPENQADAATAALVDAMTSELYGVAILAEPSAPSFAWADSV